MWVWCNRARAPWVVFGVCAVVYTAMLGARVRWTAANNPFGSHYVHLANSYLHGQLHVVGNQPLGIDDESFFDGKWQISFPPFPAVLLVPFVAVGGLHTPAALLWALLAAVAPALLYVLLRSLRESGDSVTDETFDRWLVAAYAFGSPLFFTAVQGTVWFAAHAVGSVLMVGFLYGVIRLRTMWGAGLALGLCFMTRPTTLVAGVLVLLELVRAWRLPSDSTPSQPRGGEWVRWIRPAAQFAAPMVVVVVVTLWMNWVRFHHPLEFGHKFLQVRWQHRIERWGLFDYHYLAKNLAVFWTSLPWWTSEPPYVRVTTHGIALWVACPYLLWLLWPRRLTPLAVGCYIAAGAVAVYDWLYQNTGWEQFTYRFSLDYFPILMVLVAVTHTTGFKRRRLAMMVAMVWAIGINTFGAVTFNRADRWYERDPSLLFQPD
jgi:hypothetical protein